MQGSEGENFENENSLSEIRRENVKKLIEPENSLDHTEKNDTYDSEKNLTLVRENHIQSELSSEGDTSLAMPKAIKIDDLENIENLNELFVDSSRQPREFKIPKEGMLWHLRLIQASLNYLKKLQKKRKS